MTVISRKLTGSTALLLTVGLLAAPAEAVNLTQPTYTHVSGGWTEGSRSRSGGHLDVEVELRDRFYFTGYYQMTSFRVEGERFNESIADAGMGRYFPVADGLTWDVSGSVGRAAESRNLFNSGHNFYTLNTGFRQRFDAFEGRLGYRYINREGLSSNQGFIGSIYYYFTPQTSVGVTFSDVYHSSNTSFGARVLF